MAQNDIVKRYLDAGMAFTQLSREKAEEFVKDLVKQGEVRRKEAEEVIEALVERSRKNTEDLVALIRQEIADQLRHLNLEDLAKRAGLPAPKKKGAAKKAAKKVAVPSPGSRLVVPGAPKKASAKKLVVPTSAASAGKSPTKKAGGAKSPHRSGEAALAGAPTKKVAAAKKSTKKS